MNLQGIQKLTLLDFPGRVACTIFTAGCNFRCPFCHNASLVDNPSGHATITAEEFFEFLKKRRGVLDGVAITGGEPTIQPDLYDFICKVREFGYDVKLDTNGTNPKVLKKLLDAEAVNYVAVDIKNSQAKYAETIGREKYDLTNILESVDMLMNGKTPFEFRTTVVAGLHTVESMTELAQWIAGDEPYFLQNFVDSGDILDKNMTGVDKNTMNTFLDAVKPYLPKAELRGI